MSPPTLLLRNAALDEALRAVPGDRWLEWLGVRGREARVHGLVPMSSGCWVRITVDDDGRERHFSQAFTFSRGTPEDRALARVDTDDGARDLVDAAVDADFRDALYSFALRGSDTQNDLVALKSSSTGTRPPGAVPSSRFVGRNERGRLIEYEGDSTLELFDELLAETPRDIVLGQHLALKRCSHVRTLLAKLSVRDLDTNEWRVCGALREHWPKTVPGPIAFRGELDRARRSDRARDLGRALWNLHQSLASPVDALHIAPRVLDDEGVEMHRVRLDTSATRALDTLLRQRDSLLVDPTIADIAKELPKRLSEVRSQGAMLASKLNGAAGQRFPIHGALTLDRVERRTDGHFIFFGFEHGVSERETPLLDLAQVLHSLTLTLCDCSRDAVRETRAALFNGYFDDELDQTIVPPTPHRLLSLTQLLELRIAFDHLDATLRPGNDASCALRSVAMLVGVTR